MKSFLPALLIIGSVGSGYSQAAPYKSPAKPATASKSVPVSKPVTASNTVVKSIVSKASVVNKPVAASKPVTTSKPVAASKPVTTSKPVAMSQPTTASKTVYDRPVIANPKYGSCGNSPCTSLSQADMRYNNPSLMQKYSQPVRSSHSANDCKPVCKGQISVGGLSIMDPRAQAYKQPPKKLRTMAVNGKIIQFWE